MEIDWRRAWERERNRETNRKSQTTKTNEFACIWKKKRRRRMNVSINVLMCQVSIIYTGENPLMMWVEQCGSNGKTLKIRAKIGCRRIYSFILGDGDDRAVAVIVECFWIFQYTNLSCFWIFSLLTCYPVSLYLSLSSSACVSVRVCLCVHLVVHVP